MKYASDLTPEEIEQLYEDFWEYVDSLGFGYGRADGAELLMLKRFFTPQDVLNVMDMPKDEFFGAAEYAKIEDISEDEAREILNDLTKRANLYHEKDENGVDRYHVLPSAHGIYEFHAAVPKWADPEWIFKGTLTTMGTNPAKGFEAGVPFYHSLPSYLPAVKEGDLPDEDNIWKIMESKRRFAVIDCACAMTNRDMMDPDKCDHPTNVCILTDAMADYHLDDLNTGKEITLEQAKKIVEHGIKEGLVIQTTFSHKCEIICRCALCHCGILAGCKVFPGDARVNQSRYRLVHDTEKCIKCHACVDVCPMKSISINEDGYPVVDESCLGCGQCARPCPVDARMLVRKPEAEIRDYAEDIWESYAWMEEHRREVGIL